MKFIEVSHLKELLELYMSEPQVVPLSNVDLEKLEYLMFATGKTKSQIIREALNMMFQLHKYDT